jgi:hypothetical protein
MKRIDFSFLGDQTVVFKLSQVRALENKLSHSIYRNRIVACLATCCLLLGPGITRGADSNEIAFEIQGEYVGRIVHPDFPTKSGLQIVATSNIDFTAYLLDGGLPGAGWDQVNRVLFSASGTGNLQFQSPESPIELTRLAQYPHLIFVYHNGFRIGTFHKKYRDSPTMHLAPPAGAIVLFNGVDAPRLKDAKINPNGTLGIGAETTDLIQNARIHVEFRTPFTPEKEGQSRGNSGVYIQRRYEVQILDSFALDLEANRCGGLYRQKSADINMALPPRSWQTYDIYFYSAKFDDAGKRNQRARITVVQNGVKIHDNYELISKTGAGRAESPQPGPIWFQNHGDPVEFRNLWLVNLDDGEVLSSDLNPAYGIFEKAAGRADEQNVATDSHCLPKRTGPIQRMIGRLPGR